MSRRMTALTAHELASTFARGDVSALEITHAHLEAIAERNTDLGAYTAITADRALATAAQLDEKRARGHALPPLAGAPFAVKNLVDIAGITTLAGSRINRDYAPATVDAPVIRRLEAAGAILLGALNMGEYAYDFTGRNCHEGNSHNPHDLTRMSGGSSGGSGAAAAGGLAAITLGSDTNGSIRVPASLCGLYGLKATYGAIPRSGTFPFVASFDHIGPLARSVRDLALAFDAMAGLDPNDPVSITAPAQPVTATLEDGISGFRIARLGGYFARMGSPEAFAAVDAVARGLGVTETLEWPEVEAARAAAFIITMTEGSALHLDRLRTRAADFDPEVRDRLLAGAMLPGGWAVQAQKFRSRFQARVLELFRDHDAFIAPTTPTTAPLVDQQTFMLDGEELLVRANLGLFTQPISFVGLPVVVVPCRAANGLPIGVQIITAPGREDTALRIARTLERDGITQSGVAGT